MMLPSIKGEKGLEVKKYVCKQVSEQQSSYGI